MKKLLIFSVIVSIIIASMVLSIAIEHNTMEVFCKEIDTSECSFDYFYAIFIWLTWFIPTFVAQSAVYWLVLSVVKCFSDGGLKP
ncbi:hypothetical protein [Vibrio sp. CB1-14]|uniref:TMhelix containing protein n=1 Tax=Vibrio chaetopteri TaxID=3016528 RepID=A0AAU8BFM2_9VIBR